MDYKKLTKIADSFIKDSDEQELQSVLNSNVEGISTHGYYGVPASDRYGEQMNEIEEEINELSDSKVIDSLLGFDEPVPSKDRKGYKIKKVDTQYVIQSPDGKNCYDTESEYEAEFVLDRFKKTGLWRA